MSNWATGKMRSGSRSLYENVSQQQLGLISASAYQTRVDTQARVLRMRLRQTIENHDYEVPITTISFNPSGSLMLTGAENHQLCLRDTHTGARLEDIDAYHHTGPISHALFLPENNDNSILSSSVNGTVLVHFILEDGFRTVRNDFNRHERHAGQLALDHGCTSIFYSCGGDGIVNMNDLRENESRRIFQTTDELNSISTDHSTNVIAVGGRGMYAQLYDKRMRRLFSRLCPNHLLNRNGSGCITNLAFTTTDELLVSYKFESTFLFPEMSSESVPKEYTGAVNYGTIQGASFLGPANNYVVSGSDRGQVFIWDKKTGNRTRVLATDDYTSANCVAAHPSDLIIASAGDHLLKTWSCDH